MEDALFSLILFTGFYCLYSKMFAPKLNSTTIDAPVSTVPTTASVAAVKTVEPLTADRTTATRATSDTVKAQPATVIDQTTTAGLAPDRDSSAHKPATRGSRQTTTAVTSATRRGKQPGKERTLAQSRTN